MKEKYTKFKFVWPSKMHNFQKQQHKQELKTVFRSFSPLQNNIHFTTTQNNKQHTFHIYPKTTYISQLPQHNIHFTTTPTQHTFHNYPKTTYISQLPQHNIYFTTTPKSIHFTTSPKQHTFHNYPDILFIAYYSSIHSFISHWIFAICYWPKHQCSVTSSLIHATQNFPYYRKSKPMIFFFDFVRFMFIWFLSTLTTFSHMLVVFVHSKLTDLMHYN